MTADSISELFQRNEGWLRSPNEPVKYLASEISAKSLIQLTGFVVQFCIVFLAFGAK
jgi:hypothetical protein